MKNLTGTRFISKIQAIFLFSLLFFGSLHAQTSYNANTVPIGGTNNSAFGVSSLTGATGTDNTGLGYEALRGLTIGDNNSAVGSEALRRNQTGDNNSALGQSALYNNTTGYKNTAVGVDALYAYNGYQNTAVGVNSGVGGTLGSGNNNMTFLGFGAGSSGFGLMTNSTAIGSGALVTGSNSIQLGNSSITQVFAGTGTNASLIAGGLQITGGILSPGYVLTSDALGNATWQPGSGGGAAWGLFGNGGTVDGTNFLGTTDAVPFNLRVNNKIAGRIDLDNNTFFGLLAGNNTGKFNTAIGTEALSSNSTGLANTSLGYNSLYSNRIGSQNIAVGNKSLYNNIDGGTNISIGNNTLFNNTSSFNLIAIGEEALWSTTYSTGNTAIGNYALHDNTTGNSNTALGEVSLTKNINGYGNTAIGGAALFYNTSGANNTATGGSALGQNVTGDFNSAYGVAALGGNTGSASYNSSMGGYCLFNNNYGNYNSGLGYYANVSSGSLSNASAIGSGAMVNASNKVRIGSATVTVVEGPVAFTPSDGRFKNNINDGDVKGLEFINKLRPVVYNFDTKKFQVFLTQNLPDSVKKKYFDNTDFTKSSSIRQSGFIAQEVEKAAKEVNYDFNGVHIPETKDDNYSLAYAEFVVPLVKAVQELSKENENMKKELAEIKALLKGNISPKTEGSIKITGSEEKGKLFQNAPNPFNKSTVISYSLPIGIKKAIIVITSLNGIKVREFNIMNNKSVVIEGGNLAAGTYNYSLLIEGELIDSKQMILTH